MDTKRSLMCPKTCILPFAYLDAATMMRVPYSLDNKTVLVIASSKFSLLGVVSNDSCPVCKKVILIRLNTRLLNDIYTAQQEGVEQQGESVRRCCKKESPPRSFY